MIKFIIVTGSSGGIGQALVDTFLDDNCHVIGIDKKSSRRVHENYKEIEADLINFAKEENYRNKILDQIKKYQPKKIDNFYLINNAAIQILEEIDKISFNDWSDSFAVNSIAPFFLVQGLVNQLKMSKGSVVNISSIHSKLTKSNFGCYAASKSALESITRSLAIDLSSYGITVNAISPAAIETEMLLKGFENNPDKYENLKKHHPTKSIGSPHELAKFIKLICDNKSSFLTGAVLEFNGGIGGVLSDPDML